MGRFVLAGALLLAACAVVRAQGDEDVDETYVKVLTDKNNKKYLKKDSTWLVEFYAPWCGHCKSLKPVWAEAAKQLAAGGAETRLAKIDATENPGLTRKYGIGGYPTIKLVKDGKNRGDYTGGRDEASIIKFAKQAAGSAVVTIEEGEGLFGFVSQQDITFMLVGVGDGNMATIKAFEKIAEEDMVLGAVGFGRASLADANEWLTDEEKDFQLEGPTLLVVNTDEVTYISSRGDAAVKLETKSMEPFVKANSKPFFPELSPSKNWALTKEGKKTVLAFVDQGNEATDDYLELMRSLKKQMGSSLVIGWVDAPSHTYLLEPIGLTLDTLPEFVVVDISSMEYFKSPLLGSEEPKIKEYLNRILQGKEKAFPIKEEKKESNNQGGGGGDDSSAKGSGGGGGGGGASSGEVSGLHSRISDLQSKLSAMEMDMYKLKLEGGAGGGLTDMIIKGLGGACFLLLLGIVNLGNRVGRMESSIMQAALNGKKGN